VHLLAQNRIAVFERPINKTRKMLERKASDLSFRVK
jgi:hypothetical protein